MDLTTTYLGLKLKNPLVPSSSPLTRHLGKLRELEDAGAAAVVLYSLFEEEITADSPTLNDYLAQDAVDEAAGRAYFPPKGAAAVSGAAAYMGYIRRAKEALDIPVIASLNGVSTGGWIQHAREIEAAGADALELNIYFVPTNPDLSGGEVEQIYFDLLRDVKAVVSLPVAVKLSPYFSSMSYLAQQLAGRGAAGLVLFNRFFQPDINLETMGAQPTLGLSSGDEIRLPLRWLAILYGRVSSDLALTTGVHTATDVVKGVAAGAAVTMLASALLQNGTGHISRLLAELPLLLEKYGYDSISGLRGAASQQNCEAPAAFERANYLKLVLTEQPTIMYYS